MVGTGGCRANEGRVCTSADGTCTASPKSFCVVPRPIVPPRKKKNTTNRPNPAGKRDRTPKRDNGGTPVRFLVGFTGGLRGGG